MVAIIQPSISRQCAGSISGKPTMRKRVSSGAVLNAVISPPFEAIERALSFFDGMWAENRDLADGDEVAFCCGRVQGIDIRKLAAMTQEQENKDALRETTDEAIKRGAFGAPTFFVGDAMFWGHDRLMLVEDELRG
jgi:2-hydroxychromene-2-carboxylate isomerase